MIALIQVLGLQLLNEVPDFNVALVLPIIEFALLNLQDFLLNLMSLYISMNILMIIIP